MNSTFDPRVEVGGVNLFKGEFTSLIVRQDPPLPHHISNRAIDPARPFYLDMKWEVTGAEVPLRMNAVGDWRIYFYAESLGPGNDITLSATDVEPKGPIGAALMSWSHTVTVPPGTLPEHSPGGSSGVYNLCVVVFANSNLPGPGNDVIGFGEMPVIMSERPA